jgi:hypothetical protein
MDGLITFGTTNNLSNVFSYNRGGTRDSLPSD